MLKRIDENFMRLALELAKKQKGYTHPNPTVGAVVVKEGKVVGLGYHERAGKPHAEVIAINQAGDKAKGATLYVTLEPCTHYGRTPPCTNLIIEKGIKRVVVATLDPNPVVSGKGVERLKNAGIEVEVGVLEKEAKELNEDFFTYITQRRPYVTLKWAQTLDGKLATLMGDSKWISSFESRKLAHLLRREATAVLVGVNTVIKDDPELTVRYLPTQRQPLRVVLDPNLRIPLNSKVLDQSVAKTLVITSKGQSEKVKALKERGVEVLQLENISIPNILKALYEREVMHLLVEGGPKTLSSFLKEKIFDRICVFVAPKIMGEGLSFEGLGIKKIEESLKLKKRKSLNLGEDLYLEYAKEQS